MKLFRGGLINVTTVALVLIATSAALASSPDADWIKAAASANMLEIKAGALASERASSADWKTFGTEMVADHSQALADIKTLAAGKAVTLPASLAPADAAAYASLASKHGAAFDQAYQAFAVKSHVQANDLYNQEIASGQDSDVREVASKQLPVVQNHLTMADKMTGMSLDNLSPSK